MMYAWVENPPCNYGKEMHQMGHVGLKHIVCLGLIHCFAAGLLAAPFMGEYEGTFHPDPKVTFKAIGKVVQEARGPRIASCCTRGRRRR